MRTRSSRQKVAVLFFQVYVSVNTTQHNTSAECTSPLRSGKMVSCVSGDSKDLASKALKRGGKATLNSGFGSDDAHSCSLFFLPFPSLPLAERCQNIFALKVCLFLFIKIQIWHLLTPLAIYGFLLIPRVPCQA